MLFAQVSLLAVWGAFGTARWPLRLAGLGVAAALLNLFMAVTERNPRELIPALFAIHVLAVTGLLTGLRVAAERFNLWDGMGTCSSPGRARKSGQFFIQEIILWTASAAVYLGALRVLGVRGQVFVDEAHRLTVLGSGFAAVALVGAWLALGPGPLWVRGIGFLVMPPALTYTLMQLFAPGRGEEVAVFAFMQLPAGILAVMLLVLRRNGLVASFSSQRPAASESASVRAVGTLADN